MKKFFVYALIAGFTTGVIYLLCKKEKSDDATYEMVDNRSESGPKHQEDDISQGSHVENEMIRVKSESAKAVYERHLKANEIMKDAYQNVMEDFVEDFSDDELTKEIIIDSESVSVIKELDSISDELNDLLK